MYQKPDKALIDYGEYRWGDLRQPFRGPQPDLSQPYIACLGDGHTFGRYVARPYPALLHDELDHTVVNYGAGAAGPGFFLRDLQVMNAASGADICVVQVMSARSLSNRMFKVKMEIDQKIDVVSKTLENMFPHVDFETFTYAHNMLNQLQSLDPEGFIEVEAELREAWIARTRSMLKAVRTKRILFWFSERAPDEMTGHDEAWLKYPQHVDQEMLNAVRPFADEVVICASKEGMPQPLTVDGEHVLHTPFGMPVHENKYYPSPEMHEKAAEALKPAIARLLGSDEPPVHETETSFTI